VRLGEHTISTDEDCEVIDNEPNCIDEPPQNIPIESFTIHENYVINVKRKDHRGGQNDIALIKLMKDAELNLFVSPVCLPTKDNIQRKVNSKGDTMVVAGWGVTETGEPLC
jgi:Trypsin